MPERSRKCNCYTQLLGCDWTSQEVCGTVRKRRVPDGAQRDTGPRPAWLQESAPSRRGRSYFTGGGISARSFLVIGFRLPGLGSRFVRRRHAGILVAVDALLYLLDVSSIDQTTQRDAHGCSGRLGGRVDPAPPLNFSDQFSRPPIALRLAHEPSHGFLSSRPVVFHGRFFFDDYIWKTLRLGFFATARLELPKTLDDLVEGANSLRLAFESELRVLRVLLGTISCPQRLV